MTISQIAVQMMPLWILGLFMIWVTYNSKHKDLLRIDFKAVGKWCLFLMVVSVYRYWVFVHAPDFQLVKMDLEAVSWIPWQMTLTVFWEDAAYVLPLLLLQRLIGTSKWMFPIHLIATAYMMLSFGLGHVYQGVFAACLLTLYIPLAIRTAKEKGLGTMMACHVLYDLATILLIQYVIRTLG